MAEHTSISMAPHSPVFLGLLLAMLATSMHASPTKDGMPFHVAADKFLWACCAKMTEAAICYDSLLPRARSFEGNFFKVTTAASIIAYEQLRSFVADLRSLLRGGTGLGEFVDRSLESCVEYLEDVVLFNEDDVLASLRGLETVEGRKGKHATYDLGRVSTGVDEVATSINLVCMDNFSWWGNGILTSPAGKKMVTGNVTMTLYGGIALYLVASIKL
ncbi:hypothetical protein QOZ80_6AG0539980 [Eleusine coracana subsp. coracana]|nr:hypothetical protein QOZ80_6AG0539980 [Eleusine coracana subsp. coracana]